jgi:3-oxoisoapionate decarboxylase
VSGITNENCWFLHPECLRQSQIAIELGTRGTDCETLQHFLKLARILNAKLLRALPGPDAEQCIRKMLPAFVEAGVCLALENYEKNTSAELAALVRSINDPHVGICLDTVNSLGALETPRDVVAELGPYVLNLHVKDFQIQRVPSMIGRLLPSSVICS